MRMFKWMREDNIRNEYERSSIGVVQIVDKMVWTCYNEKEIGRCKNDNENECGWFQTNITALESLEK